MGDQTGNTRQQQQDSLVATAKDATLQELTTWTLDHPGGRRYPVQIDMDKLHQWCYDMIYPIIKNRLHKVKRFHHDQTDNEAAEHSSALASVFIQCCYQHMRESAKVRHFDIVSASMPRSLYILRQALPLPLARIVTGFGPITVTEGHLAPCVLVPYASMGVDFSISSTGTHPWREDMMQCSTAISAFKANPEMRVQEVDFIGTEGTGFWTVFPSGVNNPDCKEGFCCLPEGYYSEVDKLLATLINVPLFDVRDSQLIPIDWSMREHDVPASWRLLPVAPGLGDYVWEPQLRLDNVIYRGNRHFYGRVELLVAQTVYRADHQLAYVQPTATGSGGDGDTQMTIAVSSGSGKRQRTGADGDDGDQGVATLQPTTTRYMRVGYAHFYGCCYHGVDQDTSIRIFYKALGLL